MGIARSEVVRRIREFLGDTNPAETRFDTFRINEAVDHNVQVLGSRAIGIDATISVTILAGTSEYSVTPPSRGEVRRVREARLSSANTELIPMTEQQMNERWGNESGVPTRGVPQNYTLLETSANAWRIRFGPTPTAGDTAILNTTITPDIASLSVGPNADYTLSGGEEFQRAVECAAMADLIEHSSQAILEAAGLSKAGVQSLRADVERCLRGHNQHHISQGRRANHIGPRTSASVLGAR